MKNPITARAIENLSKALNTTSDYQLAEIVKKPAPSLNRYRNGKVSISLDGLAEMADKGGCEIEIKFNKKK